MTGLSPEKDSIPTVLIEPRSSELKSLGTVGSNEHIATEDESVRLLPDSDVKSWSTDTDPLLTHHTTSRERSNHYWRSQNSNNNRSIVGIRLRRYMVVAA